MPDDAAHDQQSSSVLIDVLDNDSLGNGPSNNLVIATAPANAP